MDHFFLWRNIDPCLVLEVLAHGDQDVVGEVVLALLLHELHELLHPLLHVVVGAVLPVHQRIVAARRRYNI